MSSIMRTTRRGLFGLLLAIPALANASVSAVGATAGQFAVQGGAATYTIPLTLPPGLGEMRPELALTYNSNGGDGPLGQGWSVSGLSAITLCPKTVAQDGAYVAASKSMAAVDQRYCLDGQRLVLTSGSWGTASAVMRTEIDSFTRVTIGSWSGAVPTSFIVKTKAGQTLYYGEVNAARSHDSVISPDPAIAWFVNKAVDAKGNFIRFYYKRPSAGAGTSAETLIDWIDYTGNDTAGVSPYASVHFNYQPLLPARYYYGGGYRFERSQKLTSIETKVNGNPVRGYFLAHGVLTRTGEDIITSVQECAWTSGVQSCLPATSFQWNQTESRFSAANVPVTNAWGGTEWVRTGDFNGDGISDIASPYGGSVYIKFGDPIYGFTTATWTTTSNWTTAANLMVGDFDGDGRSDFAFPSGSTIRVKLSRNGTFLDQQFTPAMTGGATMYWGQPYCTFVAEMNGDGRADIVTFGSSFSQMLVFLNTGTGFQGVAWTPDVYAAGAFSLDARDNFADDVNGDGITDFVGLQDNTGYSDYATYLISDPAGKRVVGSRAFIDLAGRDRRVQAMGDFDGDGLPEAGYLINGNTLVAFPPPIRGVATISKALPAAVPSDRLDWTWLSDFNGDGRVDVLTRQAGTSSMIAYQQTATGFKSSTLTSVSSWPNGSPAFLGDFTGDGQIDVALRVTTSSLTVLGATQIALTDPVTANYLGNSSDVTQPEAIAKITSGDGAIINIDYRTLAQGTAGNTAVVASAPVVAGETTVGAPIWLVNEVWSSHGAGPASETRGTSYQYFNLRMSTTGRGVLGFEAETVRDLLTGDWELTEYETSWPRNGMVRRKTSYLSDGTRVKSLDQQTQTYQPVAGGPAFPYVSLSTETAYDDVGNPMVISTSQYAGLDAYGNFGSITSTTRNPSNTVWSTKVTTNTYAPANTTNWILGRLTNTSVQHTASGATSITKTSSFSYNTSGLLEYETIEPGAIGTSAWLQTQHVYDAFGHKQSVTVSGFGYDNSARSARSTTTTVNTATIGSGYIEVTTANAKGHATIQRISVIHGGVLRTQDPNGVVVSTEYDAFGRKTGQAQGEVFPGLVWAAWSYAAANGEAGTAVQKITATDSFGGVTVEYQDLLGRTVRKDSLALDGRTITETTGYDEQGRVAEARRPAFDAYSGAPIYTRYDNRGRVRELETPGPNGSRSTTYYGYNGLITTVTDPLGHTRTEERNALGQVIRVVEGSGMSTLDSIYDAVGNLIRTVDSVGQTTSIGYDVRGRKTGMLDPAMGEWKYRYNSFGELEWQQDAKLQITQQRYDQLGRMNWRTDHGDAVATTWTYDGAAYGKGQLQSVAGKDGYAETYTYNNLGLVASVNVTIRNRGILETFTTSTEYDAQNRPWKVTRPGGFVVENQYNERGYLVSVRSPKATTSGQEAFDSAALQNRINEILSLLPSYQSIANNAAVQAANYLNASINWAAEAAALEAQTLNNASAADKQYIQTARANADLYQGYANTFQAQADAYQAEADKFDNYAQFFTQIDSDPYMQASHWVSLAQIRYNALVARVAALEAVANSCQLSITSFTNQANTYDANADAREAQILAAVQPQIIQLEQQAATSAQQAETTQVQADEAAGLVSRLQSQLSMLQANTADSANITWWRADTVDADGRITQEVVGNGLLTRREYDPASGHLLEIKTGGAGIGSTDNDIQDVGYTYDAANNVQYRWDYNIHVNTDYAYDALDRLTTAHSTHPSIAVANHVRSYGYDSAGNLDQHNDNSVGVAYNYQALNLSSADGYWTTTRKRLTNVSNVGNVVYDANGNVTQSGNRSLTWDAANYPLSISDGSNTALYTYGPSRQRLTRVESKWGGWQFQTVYGAGGYERSHITSAGTTTVEHRYAIYANGRLVANRIQTELQGASTFRAEYYHEDALNSVEVITDSVGRILRRFYYDAFGYRYNVTAMGFDDGTLMRADNPFNTYMQRGFTGHEHLDELGMIHMNGRVYDTLLRRFLSADPLIQAPHDTQSYNRYSYVRNNPLKYSDPSGFSWLSKAFKKIRKFVKQYWRPLLAIGISFIPGINAFAAGFISGLITSGGDLKGGFIGAATAGAFFGVGEAFSSASLLKTLGDSARIMKVIAHGAVGGLSSVAQGGKFGHGFLSSGFTQAFSNQIGRIDAGNFGQSPLRIAAAAVIGGTAAELGGGKFANGAVTGAFSRAFNDEHHRTYADRLRTFLGEVQESHPEEAGLFKSYLEQVPDLGSNDVRLFESVWKGFDAYARQEAMAALQVGASGVSEMGPGSFTMDNLPGEFLGAFASAFDTVSDFVSGGRFLSTSRSYMSIAVNGPSIVNETTWKQAFHSGYDPRISPYEIPR